MEITYIVISVGSFKIRVALFRTGTSSRRNYYRPDANKNKEDGDAPLKMFSLDEITKNRLN